LLYLRPSRRLMKSWLSLLKASTLLLQVQMTVHESSESVTGQGDWFQGERKCMLVNVENNDRPFALSSVRSSFSTRLRTCTQHLYCYHAERLSLKRIQSMLDYDYCHLLAQVIIIAFLQSSRPCDSWFSVITLLTDCQFALGECSRKHEEKVVEAIVSCTLFLDSSLDLNLRFTLLATNIHIP
jgi:hypothetical protein